MPQLDVLDIKNNKVGGVEAAPTIFDVKIKSFWETFSKKMLLKWWHKRPPPKVF